MLQIEILIKLFFFFFLTPFPAIAMQINVRSYVLVCENQEEKVI